MLVCCIADGRSSARAHEQVEQAERWIDARANGPNVFNFAIELLNAYDTHSDQTRIIGLLGSYHWPEVGYLIHPDFAGKGYATEGLLAFVPAFFDHVPPHNGSESGFDYIEAVTDTENGGSIKVLEKCGFRQCETRHQDFESPTHGLRDSAVFRVARPGKTLEQLGLIPQVDAVREPDEQAPVPPVQ